MLRFPIVMRLTLRGPLLSVLIATTASSAFAQTVPASGNAPAPDSKAAPASEPGSTTLLAADDPATLEQARELFWKAHSYFEKGDYVEALRLFEQTYALRQEPEVLFNLALTHQRLGHCEQARSLYQEYQERVRADVTKQLGELAQQCQVPSEPPQAEPVPAPFSITVVEPPKAQEAPPAPPATPTDTGQPKAFPYRTVGWVAVGVAAIAAGTAVYFGVKAQQAQSDYEDVYGDDETTGDQLANLEDDRNRARTVAVTLGAASGVLAAGGVTLLVLAPPASPQAEADVEPVRDLGLGLRWSRQF